MQLNKKKELASNVLGVGKGRICFAVEHLEEIKEAITRQDIIDLVKSGAIRIREIKGRLKPEKRKHRRGIGKVKKKVKKTKQEYVILTRKLRNFTRHLLITGKIKEDKYEKIRKMIRASKFKSKRHLIENLEEIQ